MIIFIILIYSTYLGNSYSSFETPFYQNNQNGVFSLDLEKEDLTKEFFDESDNVTIKYINSFDKVLSYRGDVKYEMENGTKKIILGDGVYLISITELNSKYEIIGDGINFTNNGPTNIFYDSTSQSRKTIFSLNNNLEVNLLDSQGSISNKIYLYPHMYLKYNPNYIDEVKNGDILRIKQWFTLDYFGERITINNDINPSFVEDVIGNSDENIKNIFLYIKLKYEKEEKILNDFISKNFGTIIGEGLIKRYNDLFLNDSKKVIYYKNLSIRYLTDIIKSDKIEKQKNKELVNHINDIKKYSEEDYKEIKEIIDYYTMLIVNGNKEDVESKINLSSIYNELSGSDGDFDNQLLLNINDIYFSYDFEDTSDLYKTIGDDLNLYITDVKNDEQKSYLILYLNSLIKEGFNELSKSDNIGMEDIIKIFNSYADLSIGYYDINDDTRVITGLREYIDILKSISSEIQKNFFNINDKKLLELKKTVNINTQEIEKLEKNIKKIISFYNKNKEGIADTPRNKGLKGYFELIESDFNKYFLAIKDYNTYIATYDKASKDLIQGETVNQGNSEDLSLSKEKAVEYLKQFNMLDLSDIDISIQNGNYCQNPKEELKDQELYDPYCYLIENLGIGRGVKLSFLLSPYEYNNISNFIINGDPNINRGSYKLDNEKISLEERIQTAETSEDAEKFKFENFFLLTFNPGEETNNQNNQEFIDDNEEIQESAIVRVFKRNKLLGENGDFKNLNGFLNILYDDIEVTEAGENIAEENYKVYINNSKFSYSEKNIKMYGKVSGEYNFLPNHSFINPIIEFTDQNGNPLLNGNKIELTGVYPVVEIKSEMIKFFDKYQSLNTIVMNLNNKFYQREFDIKYQNDKDALYIKNDDIYMVTQGNIIKVFRYQGRNYGNGNTQIIDITNILETINN